MMQHSDKAFFIMSVVLLRARFQVAGGIASAVEKQAFRGAVARLLGARCLWIPKPNSIVKTVTAIAGNGKYCRRSALASVMRRVLADTAKRGARGSGVC